jgi:hypothetical protein
MCGRFPVTIPSENDIMTVLVSVLEILDRREQNQGDRDRGSRIRRTRGLGGDGHLDGGRRANGRDRSGPLQTLPFLRAPAAGHLGPNHGLPLLSSPPAPPSLRPRPPSSLFPGRVVIWPRTLRGQSNRDEGGAPSTTTSSTSPAWMRSISASVALIAAAAFPSGMSTMACDGPGHRGVAALEG